MPFPSNISGSGLKVTIVPVSWVSPGEENTAEVAMQYNTSYSELTLSFANNVHTGEGGRRVWRVS